MIKILSFIPTTGWLILLVGFTLLLYYAFQIYKTRKLRRSLAETSLSQDTVASPTAMADSNPTQAPVNPLPNTPAEPVNSPRPKSGKTRTVLSVVGILLLLSGLAGTVVLVRQQQELRSRATTSLHQPPLDTCNTTQVSVREVTSCPAPKNGNTNNISTYKVIYSIKNITNKSHKVTYYDNTNYCLAPFSANGCSDSPVTSPAIDVSLAPGQSVDIPVQRTSDSGMACGSFQTDFHITAVDGNNKCYGQANTPGEPIAAGLCQTGITCQPALSCVSANISANTLKPGSTVNITSKANRNVVTFSYAFYNQDNADKPIYFTAGTPYVVKKTVTTATDTNILTVSYTDINKPDLNWAGKYPVHVKVATTFNDSSGKSTTEQSACTVIFAMGSVPPPPDCLGLTTSADMNNLKVGTEYTFQLTAGGTVTSAGLTAYGAACTNTIMPLSKQTGPAGTYTFKWTPTASGPVTLYGTVFNNTTSCQADCGNTVCTHAAACKLSGNVLTTTPPPPPPVPGTASCQMVVASKDLNNIIVGDTVTFTGYGWVSSSTDTIDKIEFLIAKAGSTVLDQVQPAVRAPEKDMGNELFFKASQQFTVPDTANYDVTIRVHWQNQNIWKD